MKRIKGEKPIDWNWEKRHSKQTMWPCVNLVSNQETLWDNWENLATDWIFDDIKQLLLLILDVIILMF